MASMTIEKLRNRCRRQERLLIIRALERNGGIRARAARELGIEASSLQAMIKSHGLQEIYAAYNPGKPGRPRKVKA